MSRPLDTAERREALSASPELAAVRHLARTHGVALRRLRRVGPVIYTVGIRGGTRLAELAAYGELHFTDEGHLQSARLYGRPESSPSLVELDHILEFGVLPEDVPATTESVEILAPTYLTIDIEPTPAPLPALLEPTPITAEVFVVTPPSRRVWIPARGTWHAPTPVPLEVQQEAVREALPSAWAVWARFFFGLLLVLQFTAVAGLAATGASVGPVHFLLSVLVALTGAVITLAAIYANDARREELQLVGLR